MIKSKFSIEEIARIPVPGFSIPSAIQFSPDDWMVTYLYSPEGNLKSQLFAFLPTSNERHLLADPKNEGVTDQNISTEEALRRERLRQWTQGITQYAWADKDLRLLIPLLGGLFVTDAPDKPLRCILENPGSAVVDPQFSHNGEWVAFVKNNEIYIIPFAGGLERQLTTGAHDSGKSHGIAEYVAQEEMDRDHGFWWSNDDSHIAFTEVDEQHISIYRILHQGKEIVGDAAQEDHHYPFTGKENVHVRLGVVSRDGGAPVWMDLGDEKDIYLARVQWLPDGRLSAQIQNREQNHLDLLVFNPQTGQSEHLLSEDNPIWINLNHHFYPLNGMGKPGEPGFIWGSERSGYCHLYLFDSKGVLLNPITQGNWVVDTISGVDETNQIIYFTASEKTPLETHLYSIDFSGKNLRRITEKPGMHLITLDHAKKRFIDTFHSTTCPPRISLHSLETGMELAVIHDQIDSRITELDIHEPEIVHFSNRVGDELHGAIYYPPAEFGRSNLPTIVSVYGGPHAQMVTNSWGMTASMRAQYLSSLGYLVFVMDNRGSARRGLAFEAAIKNDVGHFEVEDQVDGVRWLIHKGLTNPDRVGIYGWSYGGYMALMCLARAPEAFRVAVAGAPVTTWDGYDTHYTERYMGTPQSNPDGYSNASVMNYVDKITGKLLIIHGLIDENVHFRHTARLINALIHARKPYELMLFPDERHMPRKPADRIYMEERIRDFFINHL